MQMIFFLVTFMVMKCVLKAILKWRSNAMLNDVGARSALVVVVVVVFIITIIMSVRYVVCKCRCILFSMY